MPTDHPHKDQPISHAGAPLEEADAAMILVHGRGATASGMLDLARVLPRAGMAYFAPQAANNSWYPFRFMAPIEQNEPYLSSALEVIDQLFNNLIIAGIEPAKVVIAGFSQGACLASEYAARNPRRLGGLLILSGGLIGPPGALSSYEGSLDNTPVFIGCSDVDPHIPLDRVDETATVFASLDASVTKKVYPGMGHTINAGEIREAQLLLAAL